MPRLAAATTRAGSPGVRAPAADQDRVPVLPLALIGGVTLLGEWRLSRRNPDAPVGRSCPRRRAGAGRRFDTDRGPGLIPSQVPSVAASTSAGSGVDPSMDAGATGIEQAMTRLEGLDSYHVSLSASPIVGGSPGIPTGSEVTVLRAPELAFDAVIAAIDEGGDPYTIQTRAIGATAYRMASDGWYPEYGTAAELLPLYLGPGRPRRLRLGHRGRPGSATRCATADRRSTTGRPRRSRRWIRGSSRPTPATTFTIDLWVDHVRRLPRVRGGAGFGHAPQRDGLRAHDAARCHPHRRPVQCRRQADAVERHPLTRRPVVASEFGISAGACRR